MRCCTRAHMRRGRCTAGCSAKLAESEVPRMCGHEVEKAGFVLVVTEINEGCEMFWTGHSDRISNMISGSDMAGRRRAASSGSAYIANPVWALAAKACAWWS